MSRTATLAEWTRIRESFDLLVDLPPARRALRLARLDLDPFLAERVGAMLDAQDAIGILDGSPPPLSDQPAPEYASLGTGTLVGGFRIDRLIGRGGMGEVYLAHRDGADFDQRVALKMLRPEAVGRFGSFAAERRMLAGMEHPGIARLIDGGVAPDGRPFMAIEYVEGMELNRWCEGRHADLATRLDLFLALCGAVSYAHARLIVHRDIKPGNILIDRDGRAKLLDFGIARLLDAGAPERTMSQALATPHYAAPEQLDGSAVTVATDVYALGAVLFELLAGRGPWQFGDRASLPALLQRMLRDDPPAPSRVATGAVIAAARIGGDLDAIVLKAMRRAPADRYASVAALADDIRRHLAFRPVHARAGARGYRLRRYLKRNRWAIAGSGAVAAALVAGLIGTTWQAHRAAAERNVARSEAQRAEAVNQAMMLMFRDASDTSRLGSISARDLIDGTAKRLATSLPPDAPQSTAVVGALSDLYQIIENSAGAKSLLLGAMARGVGRHDVVGSAQLKLRLATILGCERNFAVARRLLGESARIWATDPIRFRRERVEAASAEAFMLRAEGRPGAATALLIDTTDDAERVYADYGRDLASWYGSLVTHLIGENRLADADATIQRGKAALMRNNRANATPVLAMRRMQADIAVRRGDLAAANAILRQVITDRGAANAASVEMAVDLMQYGQVLNALGQYARALTVLERAQPMARDYLGAGTRLAQLTTLARAQALLALGQVDAADRAFAESSPAIAARDTASPVAGARLLMRARLAWAHGDIIAARRDLVRARALFRSIGPIAAPYASAAATFQKQIERHRS